MRTTYKQTQQWMAYIIIVSIFLQSCDGPSSSPVQKGRTLEELIPNECLCPITQDIMEDPVITEDGHTYERSAIQEWLNRGKRTSPKTGAMLRDTKLIPNYSMRSLIQDLKERMPVLTKHEVTLEEARQNISRLEQKLMQVQKGTSRVKLGKKEVVLRLLPNGIELLKQLQENNVSLTLRGFNDEHMKTLAEYSIFKLAPNLQTIHLEKCAIGTVGAESFSKSLQGTQIKEVNLTWEEQPREQGREAVELSNALVNPYNGLWVRFCFRKKE
jgi:hypothetical protein